MPNKLPACGKPAAQSLPPGQPGGNSSDRRLSPSKRGYGRNHQRIRKLILSSSPLCLDCKAAGIVTEATDLDHVDGDTSNIDPENLRPLCKQCHGRKTIREQGGLISRPVTGQDRLRRRQDKPVEQCLAGEFGGECCCVECCG